MESGISVVLLAYKEAENLNVLIPKIMEEVEKTNEKYEIVVIDTKTPMDNTSEVCEKYGARYTNQELPGFGGAYCKAISEARYDKILALDSDGSHKPEHIPAMYQLFTQGYDVVIGSRYVKGGSTSDAKSSQVMSKILNTVFRICLGLKAKDLSTNYRFYRTEVVKQIHLDGVNYDVLEEILLKMKLLVGKNFRIGEVPIQFVKRNFGESKRRLLPFIWSYIKTLFRLIFIRIRGKA
ncbi:MAG: glycosyltransferase [Clostridiales bacterium]|nr:glycosyltransferase [Clostridiales bacterium]